MMMMMMMVLVVVMSLLLMAVVVSVMTIRLLIQNIKRKVVQVFQLVRMRVYPQCSTVHQVICPARIR